MTNTARPRPLAGHCIRPLAAGRAACRRAGATLALTAALVLAGCATHNQPVADFGQAAAALAERYRPVLNRPATLCEDSRLLELILTEPRFDAQALGDDGPLRLCRQLREDEAVRSVVADAIQAYGEQLALLAGADPRALNADIAAVSKQAQAIADRGGTPLFDGARVDALSKLVSLVAGLVRQQQAQKLTRELIEQAQGPLDSLVGELTLWSQGTVLPRLQTALQRRQTALRSLVAASDLGLAPGAQALPALVTPARLAQFTLLKDMEALKAEQASTQRFISAAQALLLSHRGLGDAIGQTSSQAQLAALKAFVDQVRDLRSAVLKP